jgi:threonine synthase
MLNAYDDEIGAGNIGGSGRGAHSERNDAGARARAGKTVVVSTASPFKFARDVYRAVSGEATTCDASGRSLANGCDDRGHNGGDGDGGDCNSNGYAGDDDGDDDIKYIYLLSEFSGSPVPESLRGLRARKVVHTAIASKESMKETALDLLMSL